MRFDLDGSVANNVDLTLEILTALPNIENPSLQRQDIQLEVRILGAERSGKRQRCRGNSTPKRIQIAEKLSTGPAVVKSEVARNSRRESPGSSQGGSLCCNPRRRNRIQGLETGSPLSNF